MKLEKMPSIEQVLKASADLNSDTPLLDAQILLAHVLQCSRTYLYTWPEKAVSQAHERHFRQLLARRRQGEPIAYLVKQQEFWSLSLAVSPATLIPRADTELLVEKALELPLPDDARVLDLGTGTGAIALALASERPRWQLTAVDRESSAVELCRENAGKHHLNNVDIFQSDWFSAVTGRFDLIVSNPPYIDGDDPHLSEGDVRFEPRTALVARNGGLADIDYIVANALAYLDSGSWLLVEHGCHQQAPVQALFQSRGFAGVETFQDLAGMPRATVGKKPD